MSYLYKCNRCDYEIITEGDKGFYRDGTGQRFPFSNGEYMTKRGWCYLSSRKVAGVKQGLLREAERLSKRMNYAQKSFIEKQ